MKLVLTTKTYENDGIHEWDGTGEYPQRWKDRGFTDYIVENYKSTDPKTIKEDAERLSALLYSNSESIQEEVFMWELFDDSYMSEFEKNQMEYEGKITNFEPRLSLDGTVENKSIDFDGECHVATYKLQPNQKENN